MTASRPESSPDCRTCRHYFVTYEARWPHGCRAFVMKSKRLPCFEVEENSGARCRGFEARPVAPAEARRNVRRPGRLP